MVHLAWKLCKVISLLMLPDLFLQCKRNGIIVSFVTSGIGSLTASKLLRQEFLFQSKECRAFKLELCYLKLGGKY